MGTVRATCKEVACRCISEGVSEYADAGDAAPVPGDKGGTSPEKTSTFGCSLFSEGTRDGEALFWFSILALGVVMIRLKGRMN